MPPYTGLPTPVSYGAQHIHEQALQMEADAEKKVATIARSHPDLQPAIFAPSGHAPYLVSIGGVMDRDAAYALARRSRSLGLPRDTYAQNYSH